MNTPEAEIAALPHWARVAFAAHCARRSMEMFDKAWPDAASEHRDALLQTVQAAEQSAKNGKPVDDIGGSVMRAVIVAGAALASTYGLESPGEAPPNQAEVASFSAKVAEWSATAARDGAAASTYATMEALVFCLDAARLAGSFEIVADLRRKLPQLQALASKEKWTDESPIPLAILSTMANDKPRKPWWKLW